MSSNSSERTRFTITTNGTPFGQYRGIVFLSQLGPSTRKALVNQSLNDSADELIIGSLNGAAFQRNNDSINIDNITFSPTTGVIYIQNNIITAATAAAAAVAAASAAASAATAVNPQTTAPDSNIDSEPEYNFGRYE